MWLWSCGSAPHDGGGSLGDFFITAVESTTPVEVLGRYSNLSDQGQRIEDILGMVPEAPKRAKVRTPRQAQHRLSPEEVARLVYRYRSGMKVKDLATDFGIHRDTVSEILDRARVARHQRGIPPERVDEVVTAYEAGLSLAVIGAHMEVDPGTVALTLRNAGVQLRARRGWRR